MSRRSKYLLVLVLILLLIGLYLLFMMRSLAVESDKLSDGAKSFDHSMCQYPARSTNPENGCDNSDPCDPANVAKGGNGECSTSQEDVEKLCAGGAGRCEDKNAVETSTDAEGNTVDTDGNIVKAWQGEVINDGK